MTAPPNSGANYFAGPRIDCILLWMLNRSISPHSRTAEIISIVRIVTGILMTYHGWQTFDAEAIKGYGDWLKEVNIPMPYIMAYAGKVAELLGGLLLVFGLFTRIASLLLIVVMIVITFVMNNGKIFTQDQHPFLLLLLFSVFLFYGPGKISTDFLLSRQKR